MRLNKKRQGGPIPTELPTRIDLTGGVPTFVPIVITSAIGSIETISQDGRAINTQTIMSLVTLTQAAVASAPPILTTSTSSTTPSSPTSVQTAPPSQSSSASSKGIPLSTLIPAIVVPIVVVALAAPLILYFCLTRHDRRRQRSKSRMSSRVSSKVYPEPRIEVKSPHFRQYSSETDASKASDVMNFDLGPAVDKPLPVVNIIRAPDTGYERPDVFHTSRGLESPIGQAVSRYSGSHDPPSNVIDAPQNRASIQELSEENMRIARLANDSRVSFRGRELDDISDISAPEDRTSRHVGRRGIDELSDVSSIYEDETAASSDRGGGILGNHQARRSGHLR